MGDDLELSDCRGGGGELLALAGALPTWTWSVNLIRRVLRGSRGNLPEDLENDVLDENHSWAAQRATEAATSAAVRAEMMRLADDLRVEPTRISFVAAVRFIVQEWYWNADTPTPGAIPRRLPSSPSVSH